MTTEIIHPKTTQLSPHLEEIAEEARQTSCSVEECKKTAVTRGWCAMHYRRWQRHGNPHHQGRPRACYAFSEDAVCEVESCSEPVYGKNLCRKHYGRLRRHGNPTGGRTSRGTAGRFYREEVIPCTSHECLVWPFARTRHGYGKMRQDGKAVSVSRQACEEVHGPPPTPKHEAAHSCGKGHEGCVNPKHLYWATREENLADTLEHGTRNRGERHGHSKLTEAEVRQIRGLRGKKSQEELAALFGVSRANIHAIHARKTWGWLQEESA
jgi:hypothetical protein